MSKTEWKEYKLSELLTIKYGKNQKAVEDPNGRIPIYGTGGLMGFASRPLYDKPSILIGRKGSIEKVRYVDHPFWTVDTLFYSEINKEIVLPKFLYYSMSLTNFSNYNEGTTIPSLRTETLNRLIYRIPSFKIQEKIVQILSSLDDKIELNNAINRNLEEQAQSIFKSWFIDFEPFGGKMPKDWKMGTVADIIVSHDSKRIPLSSMQRDSMKKIYPYYGATSCMDYVEDYIFDGIYLLLGEDGTVVDKDGFPILQYVEGKFWVNNHAHILTGKSGYSVEMLYLFFSMTKVQEIVTGAVQPKISQGRLNGLSAIIPNEKTAIAFDAIIQPIFAQIRTIKKEIQSLSNIRDTLLPKLMSGEMELSC